MCLAVPLKIKTIDGKNAVGEAGGLSQNVRVDFIQDLKPGDYVLVHAGFAIQKMTEKEAQENLALMQEVVHELS
ncbi:MAG TPA: HypC/HybG/HupF family hydrogenase formation chaperone [Candidatus Enterocloster faecavium]|uniref:HypC/HybG/HupF family hydrogenase formation chaperone n=1 Tax=Candidatus Enterocloster faecavium TaxID=2838560 RepID=A0A9D2L739_9FIRM|nr:HypC/HybG/HupF family hydrogenase formation chaperone [Candidatus Enterocloster faecavium]